MDILLLIQYCMTEEIMNTSFLSPKGPNINQIRLFIIFQNAEY